MIDEISEKINAFVFDYFDENSPPIYNFLVQCERDCNAMGFDKVVFYYMPGELTDRFPYNILFFKEKKHITDIVLKNRKFSTMLNILDRLPAIFLVSDFSNFPEIVPATPGGMGIEEYVFETLSDELRELVSSGRFRLPEIFTQIHDSIYELKLN